VLEVSLRKLLPLTWTLISLSIEIPFNPVVVWYLIVNGSDKVPIEA